MRPTAGVRRAVPAVTAAAVIAAAATVWHHLPVLTDIYGPFDVHGTAGQTVSGRTMELTVTGARTAPRAQGRSRAVHTAVGEWVVVDAVLAATSTFVLPRTELVVAGNTYVPSDRFALVQLGSELGPGIPQRGSWVFDVAPEFLDGATSLTLRVWEGDSRLDSRLVVSIPPAQHGDGLTVVDPVEVGA